MSSGKSLQLLCILPFGMFCLFAISMMLVKIECQIVHIFEKGIYRILKIELSVFNHFNNAKVVQ